MFKPKNEYYILLKDVHLTRNINMHMFTCMAHSKEEAIGKMVLKRRDLDPYDIRSIKENNFVDDVKLVYSGV